MKIAKLICRHIAWWLIGWPILMLASGIVNVVVFVWRGIYLAMHKERKNKTNGRINAK